jgi:methylated-DNA-protein-cysteine methyltransferase-like protein
MSPTSLSPYERIYAMVRQIPYGQVASYGQIARLVGGSGARQVGYAMAALRSGQHPDVPWHRVINSQGRISMPGPMGGDEQRRLLEQEGVVFDKDDRISFEAFGWMGGPQG